MKPWWLLAAALGVVILSGRACHSDAPAGGGNGNDYQALKKKYLWESMYVMNQPLNSMTDLLNDPDKYMIHSGKPNAEPGLRMLKKFLNDNDVSPLNIQLAFLQLNLTLQKAGYKKLPERDGIIHELPWIGKNLESIALFCDGFLSGTITHQRALEMIAAKPDHARNWVAINKLSKNPFIPATSLVEAFDKFQKSVEEHPAELKKLKLLDAKTYIEIEGFQHRYDEQMKKLDQRLKDAREKELLLPKTTANYRKTLEALSDLELERRQAILKATPKDGTIPASVTLRKGRVEEVPWHEIPDRHIVIPRTVSKKPK